MKIFISWSGNKSKEVAEYLKGWIEQILQSSEPWVSVDIEKGKRWTQEISQSLEESKFGILCITRDNLNAPWLLFEAGAISKSSDSNVCTFLIDLTSTDLTDPLALFQATRFNKEDIFKLLHNINQATQKHEGKSITTENLRKLFEVLYPDLETKINSIIKRAVKKNETVIRTERELLEESVEILRTLKQTKIEQSTNAKTLLGFYAQKYASMIGGIGAYEAGTPEHVERFMSYIGDNPLLLEAFGSREALQIYIMRVYDGLPF